MGKNNRGTIVEAGKIPTSVGLRLEIPKIPEELLKDPSRLDEVVEKKMAGVIQIQSSVTEALECTGKVADWLASCEDPMKRRIAKATVEADQKKVLAGVDGFLSAEEPIYRTAAAISYLNFEFKQEFDNHEDATNMLKNLEEKKLLIRAQQGPIMIGYQRYDVSSEFGLEPEDLVQIQAAVKSFATKFLQLVHKQREEKVKDLSGESTLTLKQFCDGVQGKHLLVVPAESYMVDGEERWRAGGNLLLEIRGKEILLVDSSGAVEKTVANMIDMDVRLPHYTLQWELPPGGGKNAFPKVRDGVMNSRKLNESDAENYVRKMQALWYLITRGLDAKTWEEDMNKLKEEYAQKATISTVQFYGLNGSLTPKPGDPLLKFEGAFKIGQDTFYDVFLLGRRTTEEGKDFFQVLEAPEHVKNLLEPMCFEKNEEGENFSKLPPTLQRFLKAVRAKTDFNTEIGKIEVSKSA